MIEELGPITPVVVDSRAMVLDALDTMADHDIGSVLVVEDKQVLGIYTERDYARKGERVGRSAARTPITEVMTREVHTKIPDSIVAEVLQLMAEKDIRHMPVVDGGEVLFVISNKAILRAFAENKAFWDTTMRDFGALHRT
ncbi:hypothetical protein A2V56_05430 [Candidatus Woesebacteria bacterium RBG_19FT_COMBO_42_9]|uniref:CBS domain-containing protein n=1 Tax=Candidatus Woesebacteria bacterium RBG_16_42_24 TaxID=1802485 RepID=A0A1F7XM40_9BACT|nr:MAG: hypothetical protein A2V97_03715 [Candidatus Woesebacteria bacterium RBG_16_42_24]OGM17342.1 MAG: hypothetical protein A2V56_05430 [Candidatus Woesebacteria bacterium RBG_19FT_COMBO_42_9]OGM67258.1 MAG: hypothetical protein A2985_03810 [Candidatus Woesebacteria bacterium RIFCSPLOWO2_01_FULL_43_11]